MSRVGIAIIGAGPYGMSVAAHLAAHGIEHRIFGEPMRFWSDIARAGSARYLKSFCFGTNISSPVPGSSFADYSLPLGLETFEPCSISQFADYGRWFQQKNVTWAEPVEVLHVARAREGFSITLSSGERCDAAHVIMATGLSYFAHVPAELATLPPHLAIHTSRVDSFAAFKGARVAVIGAGQSALEAAALLQEAGAEPRLLVRASGISWHTRASRNPSLWQRLRSPISDLGTGPKAWFLTRYPGAMHRMPARWRINFARRHLPAEGAWWLRPRVEGVVPVEFGVAVAAARETEAGVVLTLRNERGTSERVFDHVIAGCGYVVDVDRIGLLDAPLRAAIRRLEGAPWLNAVFETSVPGMRFVGPASSMSFGPLFRFVAGAAYTARIVCDDLAGTGRRIG